MHTEQVIVFMRTVESKAVIMEYIQLLIIHIFLDWLGEETKLKMELFWWNHSFYTFLGILRHPMSKQKFFQFYVRHTFLYNENLFHIRTEYSKDTLVIE